MTHQTYHKIAATTALVSLLFVTALLPAGARAGSKTDKRSAPAIRVTPPTPVTPDGHRWLTEALPRSIFDIEAFMARASREVRIGELENCFDSDVVRRFVVGDRLMSSPSGRRGQAPLPGLRG